MKIELRSTPHRKIPVSDILPNPHRDLEANPVSPERVEQLLESFDRTGFWDNIVVREHPKREGKFELAYGHNRLAALKNNGVEADTITIPVAKLSDWEMYCAMVDENEMQGTVTPKVAAENIDRGCDLIERALKKIGEEGTWEQFNEAIGRVVPTGTTRDDGHGFEQVRDTFFEGEGLGRRFLSDFLPCGKMRNTTISDIVNTRYAEDREKAKRAKAKLKEQEADEKDRLAKEAENQKERERLEREAEKDRQEAKKLNDAAEKIGKGKIAKDVLMMFDTPNRMSDFAAAVRRLGIDSKHHKAAAKFVLKQGIMHDRIERELATWWDETSGAAAARRKKAEKDAEREKFRKAISGKDPVEYLTKIVGDLKDIEPRIKMVLKHVEAFGPRERAIISGKIADFANLLNSLVRRERETLTGAKDVTPAKTMLSHQKR